MVKRYEMKRDCMADCFCEIDEGGRGGEAALDAVMACRPKVMRTRSWVRHREPACT